MKEIRFFLCIVLVNFVSYSQTFHKKKSIQDSAFSSRWNLVPILAFDPDNGFRYGATINLFRIKKSDITADRRPFTDNLFIRGFHSTKNNFQSVLLLETNSLIRKSKCFFELSAAKEASFEFFGVNGYQSIYNQQIINPNHPDFISTNYYKHNKTFYKLRFDHQYFIRSPYLRILNGLSFTYTRAQFDSSQLIYQYTNNNLLRHAKNGERFIQYTLGLVAENRNNQFYCTKGYWNESMLVFSSDLKGQNFIKSVFTFRNYVPLVTKKNMLMSRFSFQNTLFGETPYNLMGLYYDSRLSSDGIGGIFTMRGKPRNRLLADGFILSNLELKRTLIKQNIRRSTIHLDLSLFADQYFITQQFKLKNSFPNPNLIEEKDKRYVATSGIGAYLVFNESNVVTVNFGYPLTKNEQGGRLYIGAGFMF